MTDDTTYAETRHTPARRRLRAIATASGRLDVGSSQTGGVTGSTDLDFIVSRLGINACEDLERLRAAGEKLAWRRWRPFRG